MVLRLGNAVIGVRSLVGMVLVVWEGSSTQSIIFSETDRHARPV